MVSIMHKKMVWAVLAAGIFLAVSIGAYSMFFSSYKYKDEGIRLLIGVSQDNLTEPRSLVFKQVIEEYIKGFEDVKVIFYDAGNSVDKQVANVHEMVRLGVNLIILLPVDGDKLVPVVESTVNAGIPVINIKKKLNTDKCISYIGCDYRLLGKKAGEHIREEFKDKQVNVLEIGGREDSSMTKEISSGFTEAIKMLPNIHRKYVYYTDGTRKNAEEILRKAKKDFSEMTVVFGHNDMIAWGAFKVFTEKGLRIVNFVGIDGLPALDGGVELVRQGILSASLSYPTGGQMAIDTALAVLEGKTVPSYIPLEASVVTNQNLYDFRFEEKIKGIANYLN